MERVKQEIAHLGISVTKKRNTRNMAVIHIIESSLLGKMIKIFRHIQIILQHNHSFIDLHQITACQNIILQSDIGLMQNQLLFSKMPGKRFRHLLYTISPWMVDGKYQIHFVILITCLLKRMQKALQWLCTIITRNHYSNIHNLFQSQDLFYSYNLQALYLGNPP